MGGPQRLAAAVAAARPARAAVCVLLVGGEPAVSHMGGGCPAQLSDE